MRAALDGGQLPRHGAHAAGGDLRLADHPAADVQRDGGRGEGELVGLPVAHLQVAGPQRARMGRDLDRGDQLARPEGLFAVGVLPGRSRKSAKGRCAPRPGPSRCTRASSAAKATATSEGWVATQCSEVPRIAWVRLKPSTRGATRAGLALVAGGGHVTEVRAAGALHDVAADGGHVPQLGRRAQLQRLEITGYVARTLGWAAASAIRTSAPMRSRRRSR